MTGKTRTRRKKAAARSVGLSASETRSSPTAAMRELQRLVEEDGAAAAAAGKFNIDKVRPEDIAQTGGPAGEEQEKEP